jgi:hypothetical protein
MTANLDKTISKENVSDSDHRDHLRESNPSMMHAERTQITEALQQWATKAPKDELVVELAGEDRYLTPCQVYLEVERNTPDGQAILRILEQGVWEDGLKQIVSRLADKGI